MVKIIKKTIKYLLNIFKFFLLKKKNIFIDLTSSVNRSVLNENIKIFRGVSFNDSFIGKYSYINEYCTLNNVQIGSFCSIAPYTTIIYGTHPLEFVSTHPVFYSTGKQCGISFTNKQLLNEFNFVQGTTRSCIIENDVWIGYGVKIIEGVKISNGAVVLAGSVVTKDVEAYSVVGGVPAKHIKFRFSKEKINFLQEFKWWDKPEQWIKDNIELFYNVDTLYKASVKKN